MLYGRRYCNAKHESETFIKKLRKNYESLSSSLRSGGNVLLEFLAQEANEVLTMHGYITHEVVASYAPIIASYSLQCAH